MITLVPAGPDAAELILPVFYDDGVMQTGSLPTKPDETNINEWLDSDNRREDTRLVILEKTGELVGFGGLWNGAPTCNLGYFIHPDFAGRGIATMTAKLLLDEALSRPEITKITAATFQTNPASRRVLEKVGFTCTGSFTENLETRGGMRDHWSFEYFNK
ncbi:GNAT family N-acetyltransferase [Curvivirga sp.]|uniref:GNAT family N-acetyltransferase n=1 Tax=Curvivirga sp. TaxID=2856848 RepID=UPI003B5A0AE0